VKRKSAAQRVDPLLEAARVVGIVRVHNGMVEFMGNDTTP
jgi:hypothetical protein